MDPSSSGKMLVTGGGGYFGFKLGRALASQGLSVILLDLHKPTWDTPDGAAFYQCDIRDYSSLYKVCDGVECIFHTASYGMSGPEQVLLITPVFDLTWNDNVLFLLCCVICVLSVCKERGIPKLVYTSTINVVFAGKPIEDGDEDSVPCVSLDMVSTYIVKTLSCRNEVRGMAHGSGVLLRTCVLRPGGIYGPDERRHLHRVNVERRLFSFSFGDPEARMNWVHVDNLVLAHTLAAEALTSKRHCVSGQAYFINDGESVNLFEWLTPLFENLGYSRPLMHLPVSLVYMAEIPLLFTRNEVNRHYLFCFFFKLSCQTFSELWITSLSLFSFCSCWL
uniref:Short chain dehydrogenase/reductase family 42E, member 2 n=1 Tax=Myripristis murdjan TaxID=586833 RepID=A0A667XNR9_9TELE